ncbi:inorganic triphosphatase [Halopseudomonas nanhaiensis]|uniref:CYTH domain-containing protein n=1 Tax=Halopseudomonas nanhaiensis TaxID=2830842 RepID=UPI001CBD2C3B|nr:CYTH domain-containing protein [Halopseudomonas nanhaiensis]UAW98886.1 inorganic triphosphatase [Halopseudomonas nanhaiensis]
MAKETEIKLRVTPATLDALREHPLLNERRTGDWQSGTLYNQYFDTVDRDLARAKVALRIRRDGDTFIQTLKSRGQSVAGLSERNEWDWYLQGDALDLSLLDDSCWPASLGDLDRTSIVPLFTTHFQRTKALIGWQRGDETVEVEVALDAGTVQAGEQQETICELELEVRQGPAVAVLELAAALAADLPLMPCDISKAERGYRLTDPASFALRPAVPDWQAETPVDEVIAGSGWQLLGQIQRLAEQYRHTGQFKLFRDMTAGIAELRALFGVFDMGLPRSAAQPFLAPLDQLLDAFRPQVLAGWADDEAGQAARDQAPISFDAAVTDPAWGQLFIQLALWLHVRGWQQDRPPRGDRIGALALPRWLLGAVAREIQELQVPHHNEPDSAVSEWLDQLPRLGRLHYLLAHFRTHLDVPAADRLFGELNKLQALLEQYPLVDVEQQPALLAALRKQGQRLRKLDAWRELNS